MGWLSNLDGLTMSALNWAWELARDRDHDGYSMDDPDTTRLPDHLGSLYINGNTGPCVDRPNDPHMPKQKVVGLTR